MTKRRPPLSIDAALARIAGQLERGWAEMSTIVRRSEATVRAWGDADRREQMPIDAAITLDLAYRSAGGDGAPIFEAYAHKLQADGETWFADQIALGRYAAEIIRECGEAGSAVVLSSQPGASVAQRREALREVEEAIGVLTRARMMLGTRAPFSDGVHHAHPSTAPPPQNKGPCGGSRNWPPAASPNPFSFDHRSGCKPRFRVRFCAAFFRRTRMPIKPSNGSHPQSHYAAKAHARLRLLSALTGLLGIGLVIALLITGAPAHG